MRNYSENEIQYPQKLSEFEVQSELYQLLISEGIDCRGHVESRVRINGACCRVQFDLVVFVNKQAVVVIECKNRLESSDHLGARQRSRYGEFGIPVLVCDGREMIDEVAARIVRLINAVPEEPVILLRNL